jgi:hypothetical protein
VSKRGSEFQSNNPSTLRFTLFVNVEQLCVRCLRVQALAAVKSAQVLTGNSRLGVDCVQHGNMDMSVQKVFETLIGKQQQLMLATQVVKMILKVRQLRICDMT